MQNIDPEEEKKIKNILNYSYIKIDPSNYISQFFQNREILIDKLQIDIDYKDNNLNNFKTDLIANYLPEDFLKRKTEEKVKINSDIHTINVLKRILQNIILKNTINKNDENILLLFQKKFEVSHKIYEKYDASMKKKSSSYNNIIIYSLLSIIFSLYFMKTKKFNLLNSVFKLNDLILKSGWNISNSEKKLVRLFVTFEKVILNNLYEL